MKAPAKATILVADDNEAGRYAKMRVLKSAGFDVIESSTGAQTLELVRARLPDLLLLDVKMPDMNGFEVCQRLRADPLTESLAIVQISASFQEPGDRVRGLEGGADTFLLSPTEPEVLIATVRAMLRLRRAESAAKESEARLRAVLDNTAAVTYALDTDNRYLFVNRRFEEVHALQPGGAIGMRLEDVLPAAFAPPLAENNRSVLSAGQSLEFEEVIPDQIGPRTYASVKSPLRNSAGQLAGVVSVSIDITERKQLEARLQESIGRLNLADRRKDEFLAILAHELRNPLAPIRHAVNIARMDSASDDQRRWAHEVIERQIAQMSRLLDDLLEASRISRGRVELRKEPTELASALRTVVETVRPMIDAKRHELTVSMPEQPIWLDADPVRLAQIFINLLANAAKYTDPKGHIRLEVTRKSSLVRVSIRDDGIGLSHDMLHRVFEMFSQGPRALERSEGGLGIGLALVRGLVELHGGEVVAKSEGAGKGSEFVVTLPVVSSPEQGAQRPAQESCNRKTDSRRVLVADDNRDSAESLAVILRLQGHQVEVAHDGRQALEQAASFRPEIVLLDIGMPEVNGYDVAKRIRAEPWGRAMVLVAISGWGQANDKRLAAEAGFDKHLTKPVDPTILVSMITA